MFTKIRMKEEKGFTLIELLIVVAIIGILAAIALPQFAAYRKRGYVATLNSDAKNAYTAAQAILAENVAATPSCANLEAAGYKPSTGTTCASTITSSAGSIIITGTVSWGLSTNTATIDYVGVLTPAAS